MKTCFLFAISLLGFTPIKAQFNDLEATELALRRIANIRSEGSNSNRYANVQGSPYLNEGWRNGRLFLKNQDSATTDILINIDLVSQLVLVQLRDGSVGMISPLSIQKIEIQGDSYSYRSFIIETEDRLLGNLNNSPTFCEILYEGKFRLIRQIHKRMYQPYATPYTTSDGHREITTIENIWLQSPENQSYQKLKLTRKSIEKALPTYRDRIRQLSKKHDLDLTNLSDAVQLFKFLDKT
ncbi:MAG: hypothetical protein SFU99_06705 [Saprospiraceae bacterium]|nr:hypothetical protein [Saprospiraceae bacterium]